MPVCFKNRTGFFKNNVNIYLWGCVNLCFLVLLYWNNFKHDKKHNALDMKGITMSDKNNGWNQPEEKFPETEFEDSFAGFFSEEEEATLSDKEKKRKKKGNKGPDILAVAESDDEGFVITEVVALDTGSKIVAIKEEAEEEETDSEEQEESFEHEEEDDEHEEEETSSGDAQEEEKSSEEENSGSEKEKKVLFKRAKNLINKRRKHKYMATVGAVLIALAFIGSLAVFSVLVNFGARILDDTNRKEAFEWKIYPLLMLDPATFENPNQLDEVVLLKTSLWSALLENRTRYSYDEYGMLLVPASDLDVAAKKLYGNAVALEHQSFSEGYDFYYLYDEETNTYSVPVMGQTAAYVPKVVEINKDGNIYTLIVGYVAPTTLWNVSEDGSSESVPSKYLYYDLEKIDRNEYVIKSVRNIPADELPEDLEVSTMQSLNETQYIDYDAIQQEQMNQQIGENVPEEETAEENSAEETTEENSEETSSEDEN